MPPSFLANKQADINRPTSLEQIVACRHDNLKWPDNFSRQMIAFGRSTTYVDLFGSLRHLSASLADAGCRPIAVASGFDPLLQNPLLQNPTERDNLMADVTISARDNGPLLVSGSVSLTDHTGNAYDLGGKETIALCRCGATENRPFCDGAHKSCGFEACETAPSA